MTFTDDFNRANEALDTSANWTRTGGGLVALQVHTNRVRRNGNSGSAQQSFICTDQGSANHYTQVDLIENYANRAEEYACINLVDADNFIGIRTTDATSTGLKVDKLVTGTRTQLMSAQPTLTNTYKLERINSTTVRLYEDSGGGFSQVGSDMTVSDHNTETSQGFRADLADTTNTGLWDNFEAGLYVASGGPPSGSMGLLGVGK